MRSVTYSVGVSVDGYIVGPDGDFDRTAPDEEIFRFVGVNPGRIFLDEGSEGGARFRQFSFLTQLGCSLKLRQR